MNKLQILKKKWPVSFWVVDSLLIASISYPSNRAILIALLAEMLKNYKIMMFSQYVDENQWKFDNRKSFSERIRSKYSFDISITSNYVDLTVPKEAEKVFILHGVGTPNYDLLNDVIRFGMTNLPNIIYGLDYQPKDWLPDLINLNSSVVKWFNLEIPPNELVDVIEKVGLISYTSDYSLCFGVLQINHLAKLIKVINQLATENSLMLTYNIKPMF